MRAVRFDRDGTTETVLVETNRALQQRVELHAAIEKIGRVGHWTNGRREGLADPVLTHRRTVDGDIFGFAAKVGELSEVLQTELGYHLVRCDAIRPEGIAPYPEVAPRIRLVMEQNRRKLCQHGWMKELQESAKKAQTAEEH